MGPWVIREVQLWPSRIPTILRATFKIQENLTYNSQKKTFCGILCKRPHSTNQVLYICFVSQPSTLGCLVVQFPNMNVIPLVNKPYVNGVTLTGQNLSLKYCQSLDQTICQQKRFRSFKRGTVRLCRSKGCKVVACQTLKIITLSGTQTLAIWFEWGLGDRQDFFQISNFDSL